MKQTDIEDQRSLERFGRKWFRQGRHEEVRQGRHEEVRQGRHEGQLWQMVSRKFGRVLCGE